MSKESEKKGIEASFKSMDTDLLAMHGLYSLKS